VKAPHLLRAEGPPELYAPLFRAARQEGLRLGWLDVGAGARLRGAMETGEGDPEGGAETSPAEAVPDGRTAPGETSSAARHETAGETGRATPPAPVPERLESAAALGALRAVGVGGGRSVAVKPLRGAPVLRDLLREHFRGCAAVLVAGDGAPAEIPFLVADGDAWTVRTSGAAGLRLGAAELVRRLRRPRPWGAAGPGGGGGDATGRAS